MYNMDIQNRCTELMYKINVLTYKIEVPKSTSKINIQNQRTKSIQNRLTKLTYLTYKIYEQKYRIDVQNQRTEVQNQCTESMYRIDL